jgi:hypothetical protein
MAPTNTRTYAKRKGRPTADPDPDPDTPGPSLTPPEALNHSPKRRRTVITTDKSHDETPSTPPSGAARPRRLLNKPKKKRIVDAQPASEPPRPPVFPQSRPPVRHHKPKENAHATARSGTGGFLRDESAYIHLQRPPSRFSPLRRTPLAAALRSKTPDPNLPSVPRTVEIKKTSYIERASAAASVDLRPRPEDPHHSHLVPSFTIAEAQASSAQQRAGTTPPFLHSVSDTRGGASSQGAYLPLQMRSSVATQARSALATQQTPPWMQDSPSHQAGFSVSPSQQHRRRASCRDLFLPHNSQRLVARDPLDISFSSVDASTPKPAVRVHPNSLPFKAIAAPLSSDERSPSGSHVSRRQRGRAERLSDSLFSTTVSAPSKIVPPAALSSYQTPPLASSALPMPPITRTSSDMSLTSLAEPTVSQPSYVETEGHSSALDHLKLADDFVTAWGELDPDMAPHFHH